MTVKLKAPNGAEHDVSNGEWAAVTVVGKAFGIFSEEWDRTHDSKYSYTSDQLVKLAIIAKTNRTDCGLSGRTR